METATEEREIVIVGGGICGLATALALHRKGISSLVLERSDHMRATGTAITLRTNAWLALEYLRIGSRLRSTAVALNGCREIHLDKGTKTKVPLSKGETWCIKRIDLIVALASELPNGTIRYGCHVSSIRADPLTSLPLIQLRNGPLLKAQVLIGCDGVNSVVADYLGLNPTTVSHLSAVRGFTVCPKGHQLDDVFTINRSRGMLLGTVPIDDTQVYWFLTGVFPTVQDGETSRDQELVRRTVLQRIQNFPEGVVELVNGSDKSSLSSQQFQYRVPWDLAFRSFQKGTVTVAGDALHAMTPFIGQGGGASLEDAIVLARCLAAKLRDADSTTSNRGNGKKMRTRKCEEAIAQFLKERRRRLVRLSTLSYVYNKLEGGPSLIVKILCILVLIIFFKDPIAHTGFDCGSL